MRSLNVRPSLGGGFESSITIGQAVEVINTTPAVAVLVEASVADGDPSLLLDATPAQHLTGGAGVTWP
jgi:hypothetical protein